MEIGHKAQVSLRMPVAPPPVAKPNRQTLDTSTWLSLVFTQHAQVHSTKRFYLWMSPTSLHHLPHPLSPFSFGLPRLPRMTPPTKVCPSPLGVCEEVSPTMTSSRGDEAVTPESQGQTSSTAKKLATFFQCQFLKSGEEVSHTVIVAPYLAVHRPNGKCSTPQAR